MAEIVSCLFVGERPEPARFRTVSMDGPGPLGKPGTGGLWTCREGPGAESAWRAWCLGTGAVARLADRRVWRLTAEDPLIYAIDSRLSFELARDDHPYRSLPAWCGSGHIFDAASIDYESLAGVYDAVEVTAEGLDATRRGHGWDHGALRTWDVPTILWLRWSFASVEEIRPR